jgi:site-specific DNA-methyltransferase (adenine-specific)
MTQNKYKIDPKIKEKSKVTKEEWREFTLTVWQIANIKHSEHPAVFPEEIPHRLIKMFTFIEETVLDPFAGIGTTGKVALKLNRKAICVDQNEKYLKILKNDLEKEKIKPGKNLTMEVADSRNLSFIEDESIGIIVTSPPYWDKADYGDRDINLGNIHVYTNFFEEIRPVFEECYRVLMPGRKICIVTANVNQHTDHGLLTFPLATDFAVLLRNIGFAMVNEIIWTKNGTGGKWGSWGSQRPIFGSYPYPPNLLFKNVHEYILVFMKPPERKVKGKTVKPYSYLMSERQ